jgi:hypothetical protein
MRLFIHIVLKDLRHHLWEILLFLATVFAWALQIVHPNEWLKQNMPVLLTIVLYLIWFYLVIRITQGESLVGESEFWLTRPYRWWLLLVEKLFMLLFVINLPFLIAQLYIVHAAGLHITHVILSGLLGNQCAYFVVFTLPVMALAAITQKLTHWLVGAFLLVLELVLVITFSIRTTTFAGEAVELFCERTVLCLGLLVMAAILCLQYRRHKTLVSRMLFFGFAAAAPLIVALFHTPAMLSAAFPVLDEGVKIKLAPRSAIATSISNEYIGTPDTSSITLPITISGVPSDRMLDFEASRVTLTDANGKKLTTKWLVDRMRVLEGQSNNAIHYELSPKTFEMLKGQLLHMTVELAVKEYRLGPDSVVNTAGDRVVIPGYAECGWAQTYNYINHDHIYNYLDCQHAGRLPDLELLTIHSDEFKCRNNDDKEELPNGDVAYSFNYGNNLLTDSMFMNPVRAVGFDFSAWGPQYNRSTMLCRGFLLHARKGRLARQYRMTVDLGTVRIEPLPDVTKSSDKEKLEENFVPKYY